MDNLDKNIERFRKEYKGKPLAVVVTGGGFSLMNLFSYPGASKYFAGAIIPYDQQVTIDFLQKNVPNIMNQLDLDNYKFVDPKCASHLIMALREEYKYKELSYISCTASLTTNRYRKGKNVAHVYLSITDYDDNCENEYFTLDIPKIGEEAYNVLNASQIDEIRIKEDRIVASFIIEKILEIEAKNA